MSATIDIGRAWTESERELFDMLRTAIYQAGFGTVSMWLDTDGPLPFGIWLRPDGVPDERIGLVCDDLIGAGGTFGAALRDAIHTVEGWGQ